MDPSPAITSVGGKSYFVFSSRCWFSGKSGNSGVCEIGTSLYLKVLGMHFSLRQRSVVV